MTQSALALTQAVAGRPVTICIHAWMWLEGGMIQTYAERDDPAIAGWCVYMRSRDQEDETFDIPLNEDYPTEATARAVVDWLQTLFPEADIFDY